MVGEYRLRPPCLARCLQAPCHQRRRLRLSSRDAVCFLDAYRCVVVEEKVWKGGLGLVPVEPRLLVVWTDGFHESYDGLEPSSTLILT